MRFAQDYDIVEGTSCIYCERPNGGKFDHQPPLYVLHRFASSRLVTKRAIREKFGQCKLIPCCTICNMGLGAYHGKDDNDRRQEIANWFLLDERYPADKLILIFGYRLWDGRINQSRGTEVYQFPGVGRVIYIEALMGLVEGRYDTPDAFPDWLRLMQLELAEWLRTESRRRSRYFLDMANLQSYQLVPDARDDPRGQLK
jgi:hypothetical protein